MHGTTLKFKKKYIFYYICIIASNVQKINLYKVRVNYRILLEKKLKEAPDVESKILKHVVRGVTGYNKYSDFIGS